MIEVTTASGLTLQIDEDALDDYELLEALANQGNDGISTLTVVDHLFGDQKKLVLDHCRGPKGRVSAVKVFEIVGEVLNRLQESQSKN